MPDILELKSKWEMLEGDAAERIRRYAYYLDWYRGDHEAYMDIPAGRPAHKTNLCSRTVRMLANFTLPQVPDVSAKLESETSTGDKEESTPDYMRNLNLSEQQEKAIRRVLNYKNQGKRELSSGLNTGLTLGDTVFFVDRDDDSRLPIIQSIFPGHVRLKFKTDNFTEVEHGFVAQIVPVSYIQEKYDMVVNATTVQNISMSSLWDSNYLSTGLYTILVTYWDDKYKAKFTIGGGDEENPPSYVFVKEPVLHNKPGCPIFIIPALENPFSPYGDSVLKDVIPINKEHNDAISDESAIAKLFSRPKIIIRNASQKDIEQMKRMLQSGVIASKGNIEVTPFQFAGSIFPIEQRISKIEDRFFRQSGLGPAVFGMPPGSINTGASLTVQYAPTLQMAQIIWTSWEPRLLDMIDYIIEMLKIEGKDPVTGLKYSEIFKEKPKIELKAPFSMPRDEAITISNEIQKYQVGLQSKTRTMENVGIESPEDELELRVWEDIVLAQLLPQQVQQAGQQGRSPAAGAEAGGQIRAAQAQQGAFGAAPLPSELNPNG